MVLWEITLATAYFLGLKRTFKLALKTQRRVVSPKHPRIYQFLRGRTRAVFDVAMKVHKSIQHQDIKVGRHLSNWISRSLNLMKPSADGHPNGTNATITGMKVVKKVSNSSYLKRGASTRAVIGQKLNRYMSINSSLSRWPKPFPTIAMLLRQPKPAGTVNQNRQFSIYGYKGMKTNYRRPSLDHVIREDIMQWMLRH